LRQLSKTLTDDEW